MTRRKIAVVGGGIAGLTAGYVLARSDDVVLFDAANRLGGHAHTHELTDAGGADVFVDSGFIVHNRRTYPLFTRLLGELGVAVQRSEMSMSVTCAGCGLGLAPVTAACPAWPRACAQAAAATRPCWRRCCGSIAAPAGCWPVPAAASRAPANSRS